jgi:hypothetical protein
VTEDHKTDVVLGYYASTSDPQIGNLATPYIWGSNGLSVYFESISAGISYGTDLRLLLITYYFEGEKELWWTPGEPKLRNYSSKNKDIAVMFPGPSDVFYEVVDEERRAFIAKTTLQAIDMVEGRLGKRKLNIDFTALRRDVTIAIQKYLAQEDL